MNSTGKLHYVGDSKKGGIWASHGALSFLFSFLNPNPSRHERKLHEVVPPACYS